jgi:hypothetical protein
MQVMLLLQAAGGGGMSVVLMVRYICSRKSNNYIDHQGELEMMIRFIPPSGEAGSRMITSI